MQTVGRSESKGTERKEYTTSAVPENLRRSPITMGLLWITMVTFFPGVLIGFQWHSYELTLMQVVGCTSIAALVVLIYTVATAHLGAKSGQTYGVLGRTVFGRWGSRFISINLVWMFVAWYGLTALLLADEVTGLYSLDVSVVWLAAVIAVAMAFNNFFGFTGVANFARYLAAPVLIAWVGYSLIKAIMETPASVLADAPAHSFGFALTTVAAFTIGTATWGNECDYWRYGKPKVWYSILPVAVALAIGQVIFPTAGWMIANLSGIHDHGAATAFLNNYCFNGLPLIAALVLAISYVAVNDSNLYGSTNAVENLKKMPHKVAVTLLTIAGVLTAIGLSMTGSAQGLETIASLNCIIMPTPTIILLTEWFIGSFILKQGSYFRKIPDFQDLPVLRMPAIIALLSGYAVGIATSGVIPGLEALKVGIAPIQAWLVAIAIYMPLRLMEERSISREKRMRRHSHRRAQLIAYGDRKFAKTTVKIR